MFIKLLIAIGLIIFISEVLRRLRREERFDDHAAKADVVASACPHCGVYVGEEPVLDKKGRCNLCDKHFPHT